MLRPLRRMGDQAEDPGIIFHVNATHVRNESRSMKVWLQRNCRKNKVSTHSEAPSCESLIAANQVVPRELLEVKAMQSNR